METLDFIFNNKKKVKLPPPTVGAYYHIYHAVSDSEVTEGLCDWLTSGGPQARAYIEPIDIIKARIILSEWLKELRQREEYRPPHIEGDVQETRYRTVYHELKLVSDYTHDSFSELKKMDVLTFWRLYRDAVIYNCNKSEDGREYLDRAFANVQTKPDRAAIAQIIAMQGVR